MNYSIGYQQQLLILMLDDARLKGPRSLSFNDPIIFVSANIPCVCRKKGSWSVISTPTPGHTNNYRLQTWTLGLNTMVQKHMLCNKASTLRVVLNAAKNKYRGSSACRIGSAGSNKVLRDKSRII